MGPYNNRTDTVRYGKRTGTVRYGTVLMFCRTLVQIYRTVRLYLYSAIPLPYNTVPVPHICYGVIRCYPFKFKDYLRQATTHPEYCNPQNLHVSLRAFADIISHVFIFSIVVLRKVVSWASMLKDWLDMN
jgi:hypothetical protein